MTEPVIIAVLALGPLLWMAGGRFWKGWRRFVWPAIVMLALLSTK